MSDFRRHNMTNIAASLAYYAFLAIPSALLVVVGGFSLAAGPHAVTTTVGKLQGIMPAQAQTLLRGSLVDTTRHRGNGIVILVIGTAVAVWSLIGAMQHLAWALNIAFDRQETRGFLRKRLTALGMVLFALLGFVLLFGVLVLGPHLTTWIGRAVGAEHLTKLVWYVAEWPLLVAGLAVVFAGLTFLGPDGRRSPLRSLTGGSACAVVLWLAGSAAFAFYAAHFSSYNKTWGALAAVVVMLVWLWLSAVALLFGAEVDSVVERAQ